jgi:hypothetical protein
MDELVKLVSQKTGLSEEMSKVAVTTMLDYLKQRLPAPLAAQIDNVMAGSQLGDLGKNLGGLFGS